MIDAIAAALMHVPPIWLLAAGVFLPLGVRGFQWYRDREATGLLARCGIKRKDLAWFVSGLGVSFIIVCSLLFLILASAPVADFLRCTRKEVIELLLPLGAVFLAVQQWRAAKTEAAIDKFYDRLNLTNNRLDLWRYAKSVVSDDWLEENRFEADMYVCLELDNLEYVIQKYQRGYMDPRDACRELTCFRSRCRPGGTFKKRAVCRVNSGGYKKETVVAVDKLCNGCEQKGSCDPTS